MARALDLGNVSTRQQRIAELARQAPQMGFTSLNHYLDLGWLREAYRRTRRDAAPGVDGQTARDYEANLESNLQGLVERAKSGTYWAPPVRRVHIPKGEGSQETRPIGMPTLEDKILQRAVVMVLEPIYEQDFLNCSYGYRPKRSAHEALASLREQTIQIGGGWILEVDIRKFFDTLDHAHLRRLLRQRVRDGVLLRLLDKWLNAGVLEAGVLTHPDEGVPQGGVVSPLMSNVYLHYVLDEWFEREVKPRLRGRAFLIRYADDAVMGFACEEDARRILDLLPKRFGKYGLTLHPEKTRLVPFGRPSRGQPDSRNPNAGPGTFDFLGFTLYWGVSRQGYVVVKLQTANGRFNRAVNAFTVWCRRNCHRPVAEQHRTLSQKLTSHYGYYGITGNSRALGNLRFVVQRIWRHWLSRRSWAGHLSWIRFEQVRRAFPLPPARAVHSIYRR